MSQPINSETSSSGLNDYIHTMDERISETSMRIYFTQLRQLGKQIAKTGKETTPKSLVDHFTMLATTKRYAPRTLRMYKSAIMFWLGHEAQLVIDASGDLTAFERAFTELQQFDLRSVAPEKKTSAKKLKYFPSSVVAALEKLAHEKPTQSLLETLTFVKANLLVGLRPAEWFSARMAVYLTKTSEGGQRKNEYMLVVDNAKNTHGRSNGETREIILHDISEADLASILGFLKIVQAFQEKHIAAEQPLYTLNNAFYDRIKKSLRRNLVKVGLDLKDIPAYYSTRHQLVADCKASGLSMVEIAALLGHGAIQTHRKHYALQSFGNRNVTFRPSPECLQRTMKEAGRKHNPANLTEQTEEAAEWLNVLKHVNEKG